MVKAGYAFNSQKAYSSGMVRYFKFCSVYSLDPLELSEVNLLRFIAYMSHQGLLARTIRVYLAGLRSWLVRTGYSHIQVYTPRVKLALKSIERDNPPPVRVAPLTLSLLSRFTLYLHPSLDNVMLMAAYSLAYFACLRSAEFCWDDSLSQGLSRRDVRISDSSPPSLTLTVRASKTLIHGFTVVLGCTGILICPVCLMRAYLRMGGSPGGGPLFSYRDGRSLSYSRLVLSLKAVLARMGLNPNLYSSHSFRAGSATDAAAMGASAHFIQSLGRWRSAAYLAYLRPTPEVQAAMTRFLRHSAV